MIELIQGDCLEEMKKLPDNSVDSVVTDPPYELGFMGKSWDNTGIANNPLMWAEALRVLKPGGYLLSFGGTRTYHRMAVAIEDAGFEVRDMIEWVYGSGFPKSLNIGKAIEKQKGDYKTETKKGAGSTGKSYISNTEDYVGGEKGVFKKEYESVVVNNEWEGWGTALKPAHEPICMARKPLAEKTVAENVLKYGTGGINIDESRVGTEVRENPQYGNGGDLLAISKGGEQKWDGTKETVTGRFPANLIHDNSEEVRECFPDVKTGGRKIKTNCGDAWYKQNVDVVLPVDINNGGNASRFFKSIIYQAKASKSERNKGCEELEDKLGGSLEGGDDVRNGQPQLKMTKNNHPTVKPIALMEYLIKMVTPKGGVVLDPFMGSGSTGVAAKQNDYGFIGIDMTPEYIEIAKARIENCG